MQDPKRDQQQPESSPAEEATTAPDKVLGHIEAGPHDTELSAPPKRAPTSHRKGTHPPPAAATPTGQPAPPDTEPLTLPRGGLVAMRQSGGLLFRSREIVVYRSGKLVYRQLAPTVGEPTSHIRHVPLSELVELHHHLKQIDFARLTTAGRQYPDAFAYEIVARIGRTVKFVEVFEGSIPETLAPLIRELRSLMPDEQNT